MSAASTVAELHALRKRCAELEEQLEALGRLSHERELSDEDFRERVMDLFPATDPLGYIELDEINGCPHGFDRGLGCAVCDPAKRPT